MKPEHHGFSRVFGPLPPANHGIAPAEPFRPVLFHIVRGQHMMPNVIRGWCDSYVCPAINSTQADCYRPLLKANMAQSKPLNSAPVCLSFHRLCRLRSQASDPDIAIMVSRRDLKSIDMQIHVSRDVRQLKAMVVLLGIGFPEQQPAAAAAA